MVRICLCFGLRAKDKASSPNPRSKFTFKYPWFYRRDYKQDPIDQFNRSPSFYSTRDAYLIGHGRAYRSNRHRMSIPWWRRYSFETLVPYTRSQGSKSQTFNLAVQYRLLLSPSRNAPWHHKCDKVILARRRRQEQRHAIRCRVLQYSTYRGRRDGSTAAVADGGRL
jgi:hypothetical protein